MNCESTGFTVQDVLFLIGMQARTGELMMESGNNIGSILFYNGRILQAFSPYSRAIGDLLVEDGNITEHELIETLKLQKKNADAPLGSLLLKAGKVNLEVIEMMVQTQIRKAIEEFKSWNNLSYTFIPKDVRPYDRIHLTVQEFVLPLILTTAWNSLSEMVHAKDMQPPAAADKVSFTAQS